LSWASRHSWRSLRNNRGAGRRRPGWLSGGQPGPGEVAPAFALASTRGRHLHLELAARQDRPALLQEGLTASPAGTAQDIEKDWRRLSPLGLNQRFDHHRSPPCAEQKVADEGLPHRCSPIPLCPYPRRTTPIATDDGTVPTAILLVVGPDGLSGSGRLRGAQLHHVREGPALLAQLQQGLKG